MSNARFGLISGLLLVAVLASVVFGKLGHPFASTAYRPLAVPLEEFPGVLSEWTGTDEPLAEEVRETAGMDRYLNRLYRTASGEQVLLYICYYGNRQRGMRTIYHNPTRCLPAAGWSLVGTVKKRVELTGAPHPSVVVSLHTFRRKSTARLIANFYIVDDEVLDGPPRNKPFRLAFEKLKFSFDPGYYVQVQVVPIGAGSLEEARHTALRFLAETGRHLFRHF